MIWELDSRLVIWNYAFPCGERGLAELFLHRPPLIPSIPKFRRNARRRPAAVRAGYLADPVNVSQAIILNYCVHPKFCWTAAALSCNAAAVLQDHSTDSVTISAVIISNSRLHPKFRWRTCELSNWHHNCGIITPARTSSESISCVKLLDFNRLAFTVIVAARNYVFWKKQKDQCVKMFFWLEKEIVIAPTTGHSVKK